MSVSGVKVVAIGRDFEIQKREQIFPENKWLILG